MLFENKRQRGGEAEEGDVELDSVGEYWVVGATAEGDRYVLRLYEQIHETPKPSSEAEA